MCKIGTLLEHLGKRNSKTKHIMDHLESFRMLAEKHIDVLEGEVKRGKL